MSLHVLTKCSLFQSMTEEEINNLFSTIEYKVLDYDKDQVVQTEGDPCNNIGIIIEGVIEIRKIYPLGKSVTVTRLETSDIFGEVILYSKMENYPSTIISLTATKIMYLSKNEITSLLNHYPKIMMNLLNVLSNKILILNKKLRNLSYENLRQKVADFLLSEYKKQKNLYLDLPMSRKQMAENLGVTRPSLSRELASMKDHNIIDYYKNVIKINDLRMLEDCLL